MQLLATLKSTEGKTITYLEILYIGLRMNINDRGQLQIISHELVPEIKGSMSLTLFEFHDEKLAYLIALPQEAALVSGIQKAYDEADPFVPIAPEIETVDFKALTLADHEISNEIFKSKTYTVVNIWATTCVLCLGILPELIEWEKELPESVQFLYLTAEKEGIVSLDRRVLNQKIEELGMCPDRVLLYETGFSKMIDLILSATPVTFLVDANGKIVGDIILGSDVINAGSAYQLCYDP